ncbi:hypothetical protein ACFV9C_18180 [Kribbella sp. NPDC059898]|uniref:hypothetical protein n=1 Tax=Kribbella sp. NPDC059898 TaxID=3346995 RepID=UPI0036577635
MTAQHHEVAEHDVQSAPTTTSRWRRVRARAMALAGFVGMAAAAATVITANGWPYGQT